MHRSLSSPSRSAPHSTFQILFYALRPGFVRSQKLTGWIVASFAIQLGFDYLLYKHFGYTSSSLFHSSNPSTKKKKSHSLILTILFLK
jgi:hypothetical protein